MVELVAYGPGLTMLPDEGSPVQQRIEQVNLAMANVSFSSCGNTHANWSRRDGFSLRRSRLVPRSRHRASCA
ncbi:hypothetical protein N0B44_14710 [Roseibacterium beibuensis]|uniref:Uncharacterized protein n=1 Tax=[Roseibacterium] beibuensis TaxID=1193142 RepID=A0ABP9L7C7_9RHOB|nr:hypothetical protein [Roseibacterium beibuensis]MCS6624167.1 hypothetical protein [Roseibacterium beibuensis]